MLRAQRATEREPAFLQPVVQTSYLRWRMGAFCGDVILAKRLRMNKRERVLWPGRKAKASSKR